VTGSAGASAAVRIHAPNTTVRPGIGVKLAVPQILDLAAVTLPASVCCSWTALNYLSQHVVQRADELCCLRMATLFELFYFFAVTTPAVVGRDNHGNALAVVLKCGGILLIGTMARIAVHILLGVSAFSPLLDNARRATAVAIYACLAFWGNLGTSNWYQREQEKTEKSYKAHGNLRTTTFLLQSYPQLPSCIWLRNCTSNVIITGNPGALIRSSLTFAVGTQFNKWRSRNSVSARASETAVLSSDVCSQV